ncbi:serine/threonine-protein kinase BUD32 [Colletotrichum lupini]|uniref:EKC/KEOPS complex subunit BUD32 n=1 Tax=Colletotrichum lupini TaxID=145971 RepID=A0A9Q8SY18_9PEZI|nr:serine/threonine-protein kinase BUD32 [Colletotrichum lupini]UQC84806.1 serine/threonine-protein kinase BUD32 [Colletotrichum lupini]
MTTIPPPEGAGAGAFPLPLLLTHQTSTPPTLITQGAEARLYHTTHLSPSRPAALKYRPPKPYRHPTLDARLTRSRILAEARVLAKCRREGCPVPALYALDEVAGWLMLEWIPGAPVRVRINEWLGERRTTAAIPGEGEETPEGETGGSDATAPAPAPPAPKKDPTGIKNLMRRMGTAIGQMHKIGIVHGDLTTSNMMLRPPKSSDTNENNNDPLDGRVFIIDFGLASQSTSDEDRAVDLYVLERAFGSTHPRAEAYFQDVLDAYRDSYKQAPVTLKKLEDVRMRGRKRSMIG